MTSTPANILERIGQFLIDRHLLFTELDSLPGKEDQQLGHSLEARLRTYLETKVKDVKEDNSQLWNDLEFIADTSLKRKIWDEAKAEWDILWGSDPVPAASAPVSRAAPAPVPVPAAASATPSVDRSTPAAPSEHIIGESPPFIDPAKDPEILACIEYAREYPKTGWIRVSRKLHEKFPDICPDLKTADDLALEIKQKMETKWNQEAKQAKGKGKQRPETAAAPPPAPEPTPHKPNPALIGSTRHSPSGLTFLMPIIVGAAMGALIGLIAALVYKVQETSTTYQGTDGKPVHQVFPLEVPFYLEPYVLGIVSGVCIALALYGLLAVHHFLENRRG